MDVSGEFFKGLAQLLDVLLRAVSQFSGMSDRRRRRETARDLLAACLVADDIMRNGEALLNIAGPNPLGRVTDMHVEQRKAYAVECRRLLAEQIDRLSKLSALIEDTPVVGLLDADLKRELDAIIGTKCEGLMAIAAPVGFYLSKGALPDRQDVERFGEELAIFRYQASVLSVLFIGDEVNDDDPHINVESASANLKELQNAAARLRNLVTALFSTEEIVLLARDSENRARS